MKKLILTLLLIPLFYSCTTNKSEKLTSYVNTFIGTGGHGHTYPGASLPFGMVQLSPDTRLTGWDGCSAYHYSDSVIYGFSHTHLSGTGISDYGDILLMPTTEKYSFENGNGEYGFESGFSHSSEVAEPAYYKVDLDRYDIKAELTATERTGMHKYTFPKDAKQKIVLDLKHRDIVISSSLKVNSKNEIVGYRVSRAWAQEQYVYFVAQFSKDFSKVDIIENDSLKEGLIESKSKKIQAILHFENNKNDEIIVKVGISAVSIEGARKNLEAENPNWNFEEIKQKAQQKWEDELSKIEVEGGTKDQKIIFYTSLYHSFLNPNIFMDVDGKYRGTDMKIHQSKDFTNYTVFSLWDTFRATHPLFTITQQKRTADFIKTFLHQYENGGQLPVWELAGNYTGCMIGYHSIPVIVDAYMKGITDFDINKAFEAMKHSADMNHLGLDAYKNYGFISINDEAESVSKTLEYAYDDWCIAQIAKSLGENEDYERFIKRAQSYKNIFNPETGFMQPKKDNVWKTPFDPREVDFNFTEANSWQYSFFVPQDIQGLIKLHGGDNAFTKKLDALFNADSETSGRHQSDITGLIGQYAHGNEPSHHMAYLYNYAGKPWKAQKILRKIMDELYTNEADGLSGNEDCGQMSSWYVMSALGIYSVSPGNVEYVIGTPLFEKSTINLENEKQFVIEAKGVSEKNIYVQSALLNGKEYSKSYITHNEIMSGGSLVLTMGEKPNKNWGVNKEYRPHSEITDNQIQIAPYVVADSKTFFDSLKIEIKSSNKDAEIYFTLDGSIPNKESSKFEKPIIISESTSIKFVAYSKDLPASKVLESSFVKVPKNRKIKLISKYGKQYSAGGDYALIDNIRGGKDFRDGSWQGFDGQDFEAIVDLGKKQKINSISTGFLQSSRSWIFMPKQVEYFVSNDGKNFTSAGIIKNTVADTESETVIREFSVKLPKTTARYIKVIAKNYGKLPDWHLGAGGDSWVFVDEIVVE